jgi:hypothetical protein
MNRLPIYDISIDLDNDVEAMTCISLVSDPAVERWFECFSKESRPMRFGITDHDKHCITGVAIRAGVPIYRYSEDLGEYYVRFTSETIEKIVYKYSKQNLWNSVSLEHSGTNIDSATMVEFFIKSADKCPKGFEDVEDGSLMVTYKITDEKLWDTLKLSDELNGFSIEIMADLKPTEEYVEQSGDFWDELWGYLTGDFESKKKTEFSISKGQAINAIDKARAVMIDEGSEVRTYWPYSLARRDGKDSIILYDPVASKWSVRELSGIRDMVETKEPVGDFDYSDISYSEIIDDEDVVVTRTTHTTSIPDLIHNRTFVMISYDDEKKRPATGYRQCALIAYGYTTRGAECCRIMEVFGDSRSARDGTGRIPDYRLLLTKRIRSLKPMEGTAPWGWDILDSRVNLSGDRSMSPCIDHITEEDLSK